MVKRGFMKPPRAYYEAIATLTGCIIGAGILGIPYVVSHVGFWTGMIVVLGLGFAILVIHLLAGEVSLRSNACHQLVGYANKYLGKSGKFMMFVSMVIGVYGAMIAYTLGVSQSLSAIFGSSQFLWGVLFYVLMAFVLFWGIGMLERSEFWMEIFKLFIFAAIMLVLFSSTRFSITRLSGFSGNFLFPFGAVLFAYIGTAAIPEVREELNKCRMLTKNAIIFGSLIPIIVYVLFTVAVVGISGSSVTEIATVGIAQLVGGFGFVLLHIFAVLAMVSSFVALGYALRESYRLDLGFSGFKSWLLVLIVPVLLIAFGVHSFVRTLEIAGTFAGGIAGICIVLMHAKARIRSERRPEFIVNINWLGYSVLVLLFVVGMLYQLYQLFL